MDYLIGNRTLDLPACSIAPQPLRYRIPWITGLAVSYCKRFNMINYITGNCKSTALHVIRARFQTATFLRKKKKMPSDGMCNGLRRAHAATSLTDLLCRQKNITPKGQASEPHSQIIWMGISW
jgi:hypothetical protein